MKLSPLTTASFKGGGSPQFTLVQTGAGEVHFPEASHCSSAWPCNLYSRYLLTYYYHKRYTWYSFINMAIVRLNSLILPVSFNAGVGQSWQVDFSVETEVCILHSRGLAAGHRLTARWISIPLQVRLTLYLCWPLEDITFLTAVLGKHNRILKNVFILFCLKDNMWWDENEENSFLREIVF